MPRCVCELLEELSAHVWTETHEFLLFLLYTQEALNAYYMKNYPDFFASTGKTLVRKPDGSVLLLTETEVDQLTRDNKLTTEMPRAMKGQVADLTQKPILVLKE